MVFCTGDKITICIGSTAGGIALLILICSCVTLILLCKVIRTLRGIVNNIQFSHTTQDPENGAETVAAESEAPRVETRSPKKESSESKPPPKAGSAAAVEALYSVVSKEHCENKRNANLQIQPYDDVVLSSMEVETKPQDHANESVESQLQNANPEDTDYSRLCHSGPRMNQTKKEEHIYLNQDVGRGSLSVEDGSYSEVHSPPHPSSRVMVGNYTLIEKEDVPPSVPSRLDTSEPLFEPNLSSENVNVYDTVIDTSPSVIDDERFMSEFHNK